MVSAHPTHGLKGVLHGVPTSPRPTRVPEVAPRTEDAQAVVHGDDDDVAVGRQHAAIEHVPCPLHVGAAVEEEHHRLLPAVPDVWGGVGGVSWGVGQGNP